MPLSNLQLYLLTRVTSKHLHHSYFEKKINHTQLAHIHNQAITDDKLDDRTLLGPGVGRRCGSRRSSRLRCHRGGRFYAQRSLETRRGAAYTRRSRGRSGRRHRDRRGLAARPAALTRRAVGVLVVRGTFLSCRLVPSRTSGTVAGCSGSGGSGAVFGPVRLPGLLDVAAATGGRVGRTVVRATVVITVVVVGLLAVRSVVKLSAGSSPDHRGVAVRGLVHETVLVALVFDGDQCRQAQQAAQLVTGGNVKGTKETKSDKTNGTIQQETYTVAKQMK